MQRLQRIRSKVAPLLVDNVDTDQIIPARFLKVLDKHGLGQHCFADWRYDAEGRPLASFVLNQARHAGAQILLVGDNFGCGSSREHAPWALLGAGFRVLLGTSFADIFRNNALKNGILPVTLDAELHGRLAERLARHPELELTVDLERCRLEVPDEASIPFSLDEFARHCLLEGVDELGYLLARAPLIAQYEAERAARLAAEGTP